jgi:ferritin-like metal-binding protein YciE
MEKRITHLFVDELCDILDAEEQIAKAMPKAITAAKSADLKEALTEHLKETKQQVQRLEKVFRLLKIPRKKRSCKAAKGLIQECKDVLQKFKTKSATRDAALIAKLQRIEHYEISAYGTLRTFAKEIGVHQDVIDLFQETLEEEASADKKLTRLAEGSMLRTGINREANLSAVSAPRAASKNRTLRSLIMRTTHRTRTGRSSSYARR